MYLKNIISKTGIWAFYFLAPFISASCHSDSTLFKRVSSFHSNINFSNNITESDSLNPLDMEYLYNGAGVAIADFNNDRLADIYFTSNLESNKLYINKGNLVFDDVTTQANVKGQSRWCNAASVVDINNDGWPDIYISASIKKQGKDRRNLLYINTGLNKNGIPVFTEKAREYGLADSSFSVHAAFFDYDNDGDLDMYLLTTKMAKRDAVEFSSNRTSSDGTSDLDKLFRNDWDSRKKHPVFTDVSAGAGITLPGYGLGVAITDINQDGWKDIFVTNDFFSDDHLYINNKNGTFSEKSREFFKHSSLNAMGNDVIDINNDGLSDIITVDMNPEDNFRKKKNMSPGNYFAYQNMMTGDHSFQYVRNTLQLNMGPRINSDNTIGEPAFADIGFYAGVAETDWSWTPSVADFDNDGYRDIIVTNGYPKDITDHDFTVFRSNTRPSVLKKDILKEIPEIKIPNYAFKNTGKLTFENVTKQWGLDEPCFSTGAMYADLDNDGDLDYVISNINEKAGIYENTSNAKTGNYLEVTLLGTNKNRNGLGAWVELYYDHQTQVYENSPYRGYLSTADSKIHFGLGKTRFIDSIIIRWPEHKKEVVKNVKVNQVLTFESKNADLIDSWQISSKNEKPLFKDLTKESGVNYTHQEVDYIDFNFEKLLARKISENGPGLAAGDVDGNGLDDIFIGGNIEYPGSFLMQNAMGKFKSKPLPKLPEGFTSSENMGVLLFDADKDDDLDLYCTSGSNEVMASARIYRDKLYLNNGRGSFTLDITALPENTTSKSCIRAADIDNDGDLDLFLGGRVKPGEYPKPVSSFIYRNDSKKGQVKFTDITAQVAPKLLNIGLTCDAIWSDFDDDGRVDLILAGEFQPIVFLKNRKGNFEDVTNKSGISKDLGWWNSMAGGDFDNDGDTDYIVGNLGQNSYFRTAPQEPLTLYAKDFDKNGQLDPIFTIYLKGKDGVKKEFPAQSRDELIEQIPGLKKRFLTYQKFASAEFNEIFTNEELKGALILKANNFKSCYIENKGSGKFLIKPLPALAQLSLLNGMIADDLNDDGYLDLLVSGNDYGGEVTNGRYDAMNGLLLLGNGKGDFKPASILNSGFFVPGNAKALVKLRGVGGRYLVAASQNRGDLKIFGLKYPAKNIALNSNDKSVFLKLKSGQVRKQEVYYGSSFLSQSVNFIKGGNTVAGIEIANK